MDFFVLTKRVGLACYALSVHTSEEKAWEAAASNLDKEKLKQLGIDEALATVAAKCWCRFTDSREEYKVERTPGPEDPIYKLLDIGKDIDIHKLDEKISELYQESGFHDRNPVKIQIRMILALCDDDTEQAMKILEELK